MTHRQRFNATLNGKPADRIPFIARIELWFRRAVARNLLPDEYDGMTMWEFMRAMGFGLYGREARVFSKKIGRIEVVSREEGNLSRTEYHTPVGMVWRTQQTVRELEDAGAQLYTVEHPFKSEADYDVLAYIFERLDFQPVEGEWQAQEQEIGEDGISRANASPCPLREIMINWLGDERAIYEMHDHPDQIERLLEVLTKSYRRMQDIVLDSSADFVMTGANFTTMVTSPPIFRKYMLPYYVDFNTRLIERGKIPMAHTDGELGGGLMPLISEARFQIADAFTPPPMTSVTVRQALDAWGEKTMVFGGIPSVMLSPAVSDRDFESYFVRLVRSIRREDRFALGIGDSVGSGATVSVGVAVGMAAPRPGCGASCGPQSALMPVSMPGGIRASDQPGATSGQGGSKTPASSP